MPDIRTSWGQAAEKGTNWLTPSQAMAMAQLAHDLIEDNPDSRVFSLGQSPAWLVKAVEIDTKLFGSKTETGYIPFSGNPFSEYLFRLSTADESPYYYVPRDKQLCFEQNINNFRIHKYRDYLSSIDLNPETIIKRFQKNKTTTTIAEFISEGCGIATFLYILFSWAKENGKEMKLQEALNIRLYTNLSECEDDGREPPSSLRIANLDPIPCNCYDIDGPLLDTLWNCEDNVRIVSKHPPSNWNDKPLPPEGDPAIVKNTRQVIKEAVILCNLAPERFFDWEKRGGVVVDEVLALHPSPREQTKQTIAATSRKTRYLAKEIG